VGRSKCGSDIGSTRDEMCAVSWRDLEREPHPRWKNPAGSPVLVDCSRPVMISNRTLLFPIAEQLSDRGLRLLANVKIISVSTFATLINARAFLDFRETESP
jgi:hypothetical protein